MNLLLGAVVIALGVTLAIAGVTGSGQRLFSGLTGRTVTPAPPAPGAAGGAGGSFTARPAGYGTVLA